MNELYESVVCNHSSQKCSQWIIAIVEAKQFVNIAILFFRAAKTKLRLQTQQLV